MKENKDQAEKLRTQIEDHHSSMQEEPSFQHFNQSKIDVLDLPPRSEVHGEKKSKVRWKINLIFLRFLLLLFLLIIVLVVTYQYWGKDFFEAALTPQATNSAGETVRVVSLESKLSEELTVELSLGEDNAETIELTGRYYTIGADDSLQSIVRGYYDTLEVLDVIKRVNQLESEVLTTGQTIFLPSIDDMS